MDAKFKASIVERTEAQKNLIIRIEHLDFKHVLEVVRTAIGYNLFLNNYKVGQLKWSQLSKDFIEGYTLGVLGALGIFKNISKMKFGLVEGNNTYPSLLKFKVDNSGDFHSISLKIDKEVVLHKQVSNYLKN